MKKLVWLASWYPNDADPFTGDFIQRHARATAPFHSLDLLFIGRKPDSPQSGPNREEPVSGLTEERLYYSVSSPSPKPTGLKAATGYWKCFRQWLAVYRGANGLPGLVHVHVAMRSGLLALYLKKKHGVPYVLTEHWTGYFEDSAHPLSEKSFLFRFLLKKVLRNAELIMPVSTDLGRRMESLFGRLPVQPVPNAVDTRHFFLKTGSPPVFRFVHVSAMTEIKNPSGILRSFSRLLESGAEAELLMIGPEPAFPRAELFRSDRIRFTGPIPYESVATEMRNASAFVLFSTRENQPCVILESLCCGLPVIASRTGGIPELIDKSNGLLVDPGDEEALFNAMKEMISANSIYNSEAISRAACERYSYEAVGKAYADCYQRIR